MQDSRRSQIPTRCPEVATDAAVDIPETDPQIRIDANSVGEMNEVGPVDENLETLKKLRLSQLPAAAERYANNRTKPLPLFLQMRNEGA